MPLENSVCRESSLSVRLIQRSHSGQVFPNLLHGAVKQQGCLSYSLAVEGQGNGPGLLLYFLPWSRHMLRRMFSSRVPSNLDVNRLADAVTRLQAEGAAVTDLTESNPTRVGLAFPARLLDSLASPAGLTYDPQPCGLSGARDAVAGYLGRHGILVDPGQVVITASTSEAYTSLFKLLCDPGDAVLVPQPSYPLLEHLARLEGIEVVPYSLEYHGVWEINVDELRAKVGPRTRAVVIVNPNNPTGSFVRAAEVERVSALCRQRSMALIADEVFGFYPMDVTCSRGPSVFDVPREALTFGLGGLSKSIGLPQLKLGWILVDGAGKDVERAMRALAIICDTYLSVATPVQLAVRQLLIDGEVVTEQITERVRENYKTLERLVVAQPATRLLRVEGGWYAVVQVPAVRSEEELVLELLERERVLVHPGYFFDFPHDAFLVVSLLPHPPLFEEAAERVLARTIGGTAA